MYKTFSFINLDDKFCTIYRHITPTKTGNKMSYDYWVEGVLIKANITDTYLKDKVSDRVYPKIKEFMNGPNKISTTS